MSQSSTVDQGDAALHSCLYITNKQTKPRRKESEGSPNLKKGYTWTKREKLIMLTETQHTESLN